ncbi:MAG TPA: triphosphoribosyl-dephospho-CoA synthase, partial [Desulfuromonadales bacterium]|nr:triphosphoribosyl-dephospho-CoA synthase [Desulfuromonadales bacterium]
MNCSPLSQTERLAVSLIQGLRAELFLTPKPGLVDLIDSGSHPDLSLAKMSASIDLVANYFAHLLVALNAGATLAELVAAGRRAEERMLATLGTNTHKGAIFLGGLLLVARFRATAAEQPLQPTVAAVAREVLAFSPPAATNGQAARAAYRTGGIVAEARAGLPCLFGVALPAYRQALRAGGGAQHAAFFMLSRLMQTVEDTTALHRCGRAGLAQLQRDGRLLEAMLTEGFDPVPLLTKLNLEYRALNLTMGGVADLLGVAFGCLAYEGYAVGDW